MSLWFKQSKALQRLYLQSIMQNIEYTLVSLRSLCKHSRIFAIDNIFNFRTNLHLIHSIFTVCFKSNESRGLSGVIFLFREDIKGVFLQTILSVLYQDTVELMGNLLLYPIEEFSVKRH